MSKFMLMTTVAGVALFAGAAQAADVMPIVVPVVVATPAVVVPGPVYRIEIEADVATTDNGGVGTGLSTAIDVRTASGFGFKLEVWGSAFFDSPAPVETDISALGRIYHTVGANGTVGIFGAVNRSGPMVSYDTTVGLDADLKRDGLFLSYTLAANFDAGGYDGLQSILAVEVERGEHFRFNSVVIGALPAGGPAVLIALTELGYQIGPVTPYVQVLGVVGPLSGVGAAVGVDLELPIGDGPLTLTGGALVSLSLGGLGWEAYAGFELNPHDGPLKITGELGAFDGGNWEARLGIGVEFGEGRITGFGPRLLEDFLL